MSIRKVLGRWPSVSPRFLVGPCGAWYDGHTGEIGAVEGQNILLGYRFAEFQWDRLPALATELVQLKPDVIVTNAT